MWFAISDPYNTSAVRFRSIFCQVELGKLQKKKVHQHNTVGRVNPAHTI